MVADGNRDQASVVKPGMGAGQAAVAEPSISIEVATTRNDIAATNTVIGSIAMAAGVTTEAEHLPPPLRRRPLQWRNIETFSFGDGPDLVEQVAAFVFDGA